MGAEKCTRLIVNGAGGEEFLLCGRVRDASDRETVLGLEETDGGLGGCVILVGNGTGQVTELAWSGRD